MKGIYKISLRAMAGLIMLSSGACTKDFLEKNPLDQLSSGIFWKTEKDANLALTGLYNTLYNDGNTYATDQFAMFFWDCYTDNAYSQDNYANANTISNGTLNATSSGFPYAYYANAYSTIARTNNFLARIKETGVTGDKLNSYMGQAYFLRGFQYYYLGILYGAVPVTTEDPAGIAVDAKKAKSDQQTVLTQALNDLNSAIGLLPDAPYTDGHAVKATAQGYKMRLLMYQKKYAEALAVGKEIIAGNKFSLAADYRSNFLKPQQNSSSEIMFSVKYLNPNQSHVDPGIGQVLLEWQECMGTQGLIDSYECTDGKSIQASPLYNPADPYSKRDPRMRSTFFFPGDNAAQSWPDGVLQKSTKWDKNYYYPRKWINDGLTSIPTYGFKDDNDYVLLRYAEILLMTAEAENELNGPANAYPYVTQVRTRVAMPPFITGMSQADFREQLYHEFRVEFALEGNRYFDLRRWGRAESVLNGFVRDKDNPDIKMVYLPKFNRWPIPQTDIDRNAPLLEQTTGY